MPASFQHDTWHCRSKATPMRYSIPWQVNIAAIALMGKMRLKTCESEGPQVTNQHDRRHSQHAWSTHGRPSLQEPWTWFEQRPGSMQAHGTLYLCPHHDCDGVSSTGSVQSTTAYDRRQSLGPGRIPDDTLLGLELSLS
jgi:hypothetical protein